VDGIVWYNESAMRPDALVRFDPETEEFQSWAEETGNPLARIGPDETDTIMQSAVEMYPDIFEAERPEGW
jgi:streptogramin lyase